MPKRKIIVNIATSADGYVARSDGNLDWLTRRPAPKGFYGLPKFSRSIDAKILGRKTFDVSVKMGASFGADDVYYVFSRQPAPASLPAGVQFVRESIGAFAERLRRQAGKNIWMMGGGEIIGSFLDEDAIDGFIISIVPTFIGEGIPLIAPRHREAPLQNREGNTSTPIGEMLPSVQMPRWILRLLDPAPTSPFNPFYGRHDNRSVGQQVASGLRLASGLVGGFLILAVAFGSISTLLADAHPDARSGHSLFWVVLCFASILMFLTVNRWVAFVPAFYCLSLFKPRAL